MPLFLTFQSKKMAFQSKERLSTLFTFKNKICKVLHPNLILKIQCNIQGQRQRGGQGAWLPLLFCIAKRKNANKGKSRKDFKAETIKKAVTKVKMLPF